MLCTAEKLGSVDPGHGPPRLVKRKEGVYYTTYVVDERMQEK